MKAMGLMLAIWGVRALSPLTDLLDSNKLGVSLDDSRQVSVEYIVSDTNENVYETLVRRKGEEVARYSKWESTEKGLFCGISSISLSLGGSLTLPSSDISRYHEGSSSWLSVSGTTLSSYKLSGFEEGGLRPSFSVQVIRGKGVEAILNPEVAVENPALPESPMAVLVSGSEASVVDLEGESVFSASLGNFMASPDFAFVSDRFYSTFYVFLFQKGGKLCGFPISGAGFGRENGELMATCGNISGDTGTLAAFFDKASGSFRVAAGQAGTLTEYQVSRTGFERIDRAGPSQLSGGFSRTGSVFFGYSNEPTAATLAVFNRTSAGFVFVHSFATPPLASLDYADSSIILFKTKDGRPGKLSLAELFVNSKKPELSDYYDLSNVVSIFNSSVSDPLVGSFSSKSDDYLLVGSSATPRAIRFGDFHLSIFCQQQANINNYSQTQSLILLSGLTAEAPSLIELNALVYVPNYKALDVITYICLGIIAVTTILLLVVACFFGWKRRSSALKIDMEASY